MPTFIEVCAGAGGLSQGLIRAGFKPLLLNEIDTVCCKTLKKNHADVEVDSHDMRNIDLTEFKGTVDLLAGGVPCQSFSQAGKRKGLDDDRGNLILDFARLINECRPRCFLIENVEGLKTHENGKTFRKVLEVLEGTGYKVSHRILNAVDYGVPQKRKRLFIVGVRDEQEYTFPSSDGIEKKVLRDVLFEVPPSLGAKYPARKAEILNMVPPGGCWIDLPTEVQKEYMGGAFESEGGRRGMARRLSMDEPCLTLTTSPCQKQTERCHPLETRPLTVREYARIQTFPDSYEFVGTMAQQYKQIGNAVPVMLAYHIGLSLIEK